MAHGDASDRSKMNVIQDPATGLWHVTEGTYRNGSYTGDFSGRGHVNRVDADAELSAIRRADDVADRRGRW